MLKRMLPRLIRSTHGGGVDAAEVAAGELGVGAGRVAAAELVAVVAAVVVVVAAPARRDAAPVGADERRRRARPTRTVATVLVRPAVAIMRQ